MHLRNRGHLLFPSQFAWQRKTECLQSLPPLALIAPAITRGQSSLLRFAGYEVETKRLSRTVAMQKSNEILVLGESKRPRVYERDLPVIEKRLQNSRFCRVGHNREVILVFQFSSGL